MLVDWLIVWEWDQRNKKKLLFRDGLRERKNIETVEFYELLELFHPNPFVNQPIQKEMFTYNLWKNYLTLDCVNLLQGIIMLLVSSQPVCFRQFLDSAPWKLILLSQ